MRKENQHTEIPKNTDLEHEILNLGDRYIYGVMRFDMDAKTHQLYATQNTIAKKVNCSVQAISGAIKRLEQAGWITVQHRKGTSNIYTFYDNEKFERFFRDFIDLKWGDYKMKDFYIQLQPFIFIDKENQRAYVRYSNYELSKQMHLPFNTVNKYMNALKNNGVVEELVTTLINPKTKLPIMEKQINLDKIGQFMLYKIAEHEKRISTNEEKLQILEKCVSLQGKKIDRITKMLEMFLSEIKDAEIIED